MHLNYQDIQAILKILDDAPYDELQLDTKDFSLYLKRNDNNEWSQNLKTLSAAKPLLEKTTVEDKTSQSSETSNDKAKEPAPTEGGLIDIRSPMIGTFYRSPQPGADSFVSVGSTVAENSIIAIIEVMKLMSSIPAKIQGEICEILVEDAQLVEKGQLIMRVKPT